MISLGIRVYAFGALALGLIGLVWGDFASVWQPVPHGIMGRSLLAYAFAAALTLAALASNWRPTAAVGAAALCVLFGVVVLLHVPRVLAHPQVFGVWNGLAQQLALAAAGLLACALIAGANASAHNWLRVGQSVFAACLIIFGLAHFIYLPGTAEMVPLWLPPGQTFWTVLTGAAHIAAGVAILTRIQAQLAAVLLTVMFITFGALVHAPLLAEDPQNQFNWIMNGMNLALTGAAWITADSVYARHPS